MSLEHLMHTGSQSVESDVDAISTIMLSQAQNIISQARGGAAFRQIGESLHGSIESDKSLKEARKVILTSLLTNQESRSGRRTQLGNRKISLVPNQDKIIKEISNFTYNQEIKISEQIEFLKTIQIILSLSFCTIIIQ